MNLISSPQNVTASWADLGGPVNITRSRHLGLWLNIDINDSQNVQVRAVALQAPGSSSITLLPILTPTASTVEAVPQVIEFATDADQEILIPFDTYGLASYVQFQVQALTAGATPAQIDAASITLSSQPA